MGFVRKPRVSFGSWEHRREYLQKYKNERSAAWERKTGNSLRARVSDMPYIPYVAPPPKPVQVSPNQFAKSTQFRIHAFNVAQAVLRNREHFSEPTAKEAEAFVDGATGVGFRKENNEKTQLVDGGGALFMVDGNILPEEIHERYPQYLGFVKKARKELVDAVKKRGASIPLREIVYFWDPKQRGLVEGFVKKNAKVIEELLPATADQAELVRINALLLPFSPGPKKPIFRPQGGYYDKAPNDASLEEYRKGMAALESLSQKIRMSSASLEKKGLLSQAKRFFSAYVALKKSLVA